VRRLGPLDRTLLVSFGLLWLACFGLAIDSVVNQVPYPSVILSASPDRDGYPTVVGFVPEFGAEESGLRLGDRLLRVGGTDLRGKGHLAIYAPFVREGSLQRGIQALFEREGIVREISLPVGSRRIYWPRLPASLAFALAAVLLLVRAPQTPAGRAFAQAFMCAALFLTCTFGGHERVTYFAVALHLGSVALAGPLAVRAALLFPHGNPPTTLLGRLGPWAFVLLGLFDGSRFYEFVFPRAVGMAAMAVGDLTLFLLLLGITTRTYQHSDPIGRRQIKWVLLGVYLAVAFPVTAVVMAATEPRFIPMLVVSMATLGFIPISLVIAIARYNFFDIDQVISSTASYTLLGIVLLAGLLVAVPRASQAVSSSIGVEPGAAQLVLSLLLAGFLVPCHLLLGSRIERTFFAERHALAQGMEHFLERLSSCASARELTLLAGKQLDLLLRPESCAIYARDEHSFSPIFVRGRIVPPAFEASSPLIAALEKCGVPLSAEGLSRKRRAAELSPFDRAALETLGVPVIVPVHLRDMLVTFACLGSKRSGDVYTSTDLALLAAVADKLSDQLLRFDQDEMIHQARAMQETLRRYVPGALVDELAHGRDLGAGKREVSVLFVDIRGYAGYAEDLPADEVFSTVNRYTRCVSEIVCRHGGSVVEFNGDGMMALFGAPQALARKERAATEAGSEIVSAMASLSVHGETRLEVGVGIATGDAFVGNIQAADRLIWSAIGNTTNLAARLQGMTRELDAAIVMDESTWSRAGDTVHGFREQEAVPIRGRRRTEDLYVLPLSNATAGAV